jgi:hypothetical protein
MDGFSANDGIVVIATTNRAVSYHSTSSLQSTTYNIACLSERVANIASYMRKLRVLNSTVVQL